MTHTTNRAGALDQVRFLARSISFTLVLIVCLGMAAPANAQDNAAFVSQSVPGSMTANQSYAVSITMSNNGSNTWTAGDYYLRSQNPQDNTKWGLNRVELPNAVAPGQNVTFSFNVMPTVNGYTNFQWRMAQGTTSFGAATTNLFLNVSGTNNAAFVSQSVPEVMVPGQVYAVSVTMQNTGNTTWSEANAFRLFSQNPAFNLTWGVNRAYLSGTVAPGASVTFNFNVTAPSTPGVYNFQWMMVRVGSSAFGAVTPNVAVAVNGTNDSQFVSQTVPATMSPSQSYPVSVTLQNTGTATWAAGSYFLGSENPQANTTWGLNRVELAAPVAPGANVTLNFNVTAPSTAGTYNFQWRMVQNSTRFGAFTTNVAVNVQQAQAMTLYYVHTDHLNTPRLVADATGTTVWRWDQGEPFGNNPADENPSGLGAFDLPLRLPGQVRDKETNLHYNYFRDYDPSIGRYGESDPIGLKGGLNTYLYVAANPLLGTDPLGLAQFCCRDLDSFVFGTVLGRRHCYVVADDATVYGLYPENVGSRTIGVPRTNDPRDRGGDCFNCPKLECGPDQNACLRKAHNGYPRGTYRAYPGPNSNTYAATLARQCCQGGVPSGASGAPGFDSSPPTR